jgi:hypothetical protein
MPLLYIHFLPKYRAGLVAGETLVMGSYFACMLRNGANYLIGANQESRFLRYIVTTLIFNVAADIAFVKAGCGTAGVAIGTSLAGLLLTTLVWRRVLGPTGLAVANPWTTIFNLNFPILVAFGLIGVACIIRPDTFTTLSAGSIGCVVAIAVCVNIALYLSPLYRTQINNWRASVHRSLLQRFKANPVQAIG